MDVAQGLTEFPTSLGNVVVVDDDLHMRQSLEDLFRSVGLKTTSFPTTKAFNHEDVVGRPRCLVLDVRLPEESGLELQQRLTALSVRFPIVFITGYADVAMSVRAMKNGAVNFLAKPFRDQDLLDAVWEALQLDTTREAFETDVAEIRALAEKLSPREWDVLKGVDRGLLNKQIATELGVAEITVKMHRSNAFKKLKARNSTDMIQKVRAVIGLKPR
ncbi:response regulator transcription factor [Paraburkholderia caribensis]|uniref:response regulator transcription factor n=1 Tax=Paraburkholderia caribensis TaxID=75105 RepID=UPI000AA85C45|nr:response regulator [Paraburkholderia caribensis]